MENEFFGFLTEAALAKGCDMCVLMTSVNIRECGKRLSEVFHGKKYKNFFACKMIYRKKEIFRPGVPLCACQ